MNLTILLTNSISIRTFCKCVIKLINANISKYSVLYDLIPSLKVYIMYLAKISKLLLNILKPMLSLWPSTIPAKLILTSCCGICFIA